MFCLVKLRLQADARRRQPFYLKSEFFAELFLGLVDRVDGSTGFVRLLRQRLPHGRQLVLCRLQLTHEAHVRLVELVAFRPETFQILFQGQSLQMKFIHGAAEHNGRRLFGRDQLLTHCAQFAGQSLLVAGGGSLQAANFLGLVPALLFQTDLFTSQKFRR